MARSVLTPARFVTGACIAIAMSLIGCASKLERQATRCTPDSLRGVAAARQKAVREFRARVTSGPFYRELVQRLGQPEACDLALDEGVIRVSYRFRSGATLEARINPEAELTEQRMRLQGVDRKRAIELLKQAEHTSFGKDGCGIGWDRPAEESRGRQAGSREVSYEGETCNCRARVTYQNDSVVGLGLSSAC